MSNSQFDIPEKLYDTSNLSKSGKADALSDRPLADSSSLPESFHDAINVLRAHYSKVILVCQEKLNELEDECDKVKNLLATSSLKSNANTSNNPIFEYRNTFASTNKEGDLIQIDTKGNITVNDLNLRPGHTVDMTSKSLVSFSENNLLIKGIPVVLPFGNYTAPKIHYLNNTIYVTLTDLDTEKVYAFYSNGTAVSGFPVYGNSKVDLANPDDDKAIEIVVQSESNSFLIYQIN